MEIKPIKAIQEVVVFDKRRGSKEEHLQEAVVMEDVGALCAAPEFDIRSTKITNLGKAYLAIDKRHEFTLERLDSLFTLLGGLLGIFEFAFDLRACRRQCVRSF